MYQYRKRFTNAYDYDHSVFDSGPGRRQCVADGAPVEEDGVALLVSTNDIRSRGPGSPQARGTSVASPGAGARREPTPPPPLSLGSAEGY
jgi:hypothetical protein